MTQTLEQLSAAATGGGEWELRHDDEIWGNEGHGDIQLVTAHSIDAAFIVALVNAYRTGQLVAVSDDAVERMQEAYATFGQTGHLRSTPPSRECILAMIAAMKDTHP